MCASFISCIDEIKVDNTGVNTTQLVVEGEIDILNGPYSVSLSYATVEISDELEFTRTVPVNDARVRIYNVTDDVFEELIQIDVGEYQTNVNSSFVGVTGKSYYLEVIINEDNYQSDVVTIPEPVDIQFITIDYNFDSEKVEIGSSLIDPIGEKQFYRWTWNAYREIRTILPPIEGGPGMPGNLDTVECCATCYLAFSGNEIHILDDRLIDGGEIKNQVVSTFEVRKPVNFLVEIKQSSITNEFHDFLKLLKLQLENEGGLFDPPPYKILGNMKKIGSEEQVLGFFSANASVIDFIQFSGDPYTDRFDKFEGIENDCRLIVGADTTQPANWIQ